MFAHNLATCKPTEFLKQTNRLRKTVERWLKVTDILNIRKNHPDIEIIDENANEEEKARIQEKNDKATAETVKANLSKMLDAALEEHPEETLEILALICFVEPEHVDDYPMEEYLETIGELIKSKGVVGFFSSLATALHLNI